MKHSIWKIAKIILAFFVALGIISLCWYLIELLTLKDGETLAPFIDFVLYLLGFADLDFTNHYVQTGFSTLGLFAVTLMSSVFTVNLFELRSKVKISPKAYIKSVRSSEFNLVAANKDIYNLTASLISKCGKVVTVEEQKFPFIAKKTNQEVIFDISPGTALYKYLRTVYLQPEIEPQLILTVSYSDIDSGQDYTMAQKFQYVPSDNRQFIFAEYGSQKQDEDFEELVRDRIESNTFSICLTSAMPCNGEDIDISYECLGDNGLSVAENALCASVHMNSKKDYLPDDFTMSYITDLLDNNWTKYYDLNCALKFDYKVDENITVTLQLKCGINREIKKEVKLRCYDTFQTLVVDLKSFNREDLEYVSELCFTVFYRDVNPKTPLGTFVIKNCVLEVEE